MAGDIARSRRNRKIAAIAAGALVVGLGAAYTLASWNDSEWVWGGADGDPGIGTATFEVQQNTTAPFDDAAGWTDEEENPGGELQFSPGALALTPGDTVYAPVALRTTAGSEAASVELQGAVPAAGSPAPTHDAALAAAVQVSVYTTDAAAPPACDATFDPAGWTQILADQPLGTTSSGPQSLDADAGSTQHYCFAITLPEGADDALQGQQISPAWEFASESVAP
ncbi:SipW-dependent-type signal peptide-containing protein [Microbacterium sp. gxy059]|uniref:SipW-dependent-type signal peptide-containing protein n=1 Tax=Microbacterium sp. gxy059 TaxID=2957199 RepID=UPI003D96F480